MNNIETETRRLVPGYTDVLIDRDTCEVFKLYKGGERCLFFVSGNPGAIKSIHVNLKWLSGSHRAARKVNVLSTYKKVFSVLFTGNISATGGGANQGEYSINAGKIIQR
jgi:hypothetical protein